MYKCETFILCFYSETARANSFLEYFALIIQLYQLLYKERTNRVQIFHDIVQLVICTLGYCTVENRFD